MRTIVYVGLLAPLIGCHAAEIDFPAPTVAFVVQPTDTPAGSAIAPPIKVCVYNAANEVITAYTGPITIAPSSGTLSGVTTVNTVAGCAVFSELKISQKGNYTLKASLVDNSQTTSNPFTIS